MEFFISLFDWNLFSGNLSFSGIKSANNSRSNVGASDIWNNNDPPAMDLAVSMHGAWFLGFEITK